MIPFFYGLQLISKVLQTVTETATDFPEYVQVIQAKIQHVSTKEERLVVRQYELELINLIRDEIDVGCPYQVFVTVGASVDFVVLSRSKTPILLKGHTMTLHTTEISHVLTLCAVIDNIDIELDESTRGCIVNDYQYDSSSSDSVLIGLCGTGKTIAVALGKVHLSRLQLGTEQCFGYRRDGQRCKNRRLSSGRPQVWCNHHTSQLDQFSRYSKGMTTYQAPNWWTTSVSAAGAEIEQSS